MATLKMFSGLHRNLDSNPSNTELKRDCTYGYIDKNNPNIIEVNHSKQTNYENLTILGNYIGYYDNGYNFLNSGKTIKVPAISVNNYLWIDGYNSNSGGKRKSRRNKSKKSRKNKRKTQRRSR